VQAAPAAAPDELLRAFLDGLGGDRAPPVMALTPGLMRLVGGLLAESVGGAIDLLHARAVVKNEMRADVTAIRPRQNNPLKFSPTAAVALQHLLTPTVPGFLPAEAAMRDAFQDLRAHELAVMAGMRSALTGLLQRFDPKTLETHLTGKSGLSALLAGGRRAQLWEAYQSLFSQLSAEAEDDFHALFGRAFLQAYEGHLAQLKAADRQGGA
jgi:type VI secretion system FHA domain protein